MAPVNGSGGVAGRRKTVGCVLGVAAAWAGSDAAGASRANARGDAERSARRTRRFGMGWPRGGVRPQRYAKDGERVAGTETAAAGSCLLLSRQLLAASSSSQRPALPPSSQLVVPSSQFPVPGRCAAASRLTRGLDVLIHPEQVRRVV